MSDFFQTSVYWGVLISLMSYGVGTILKKNYKAVMIGICSGVLTSLCSVFVLAVVFQLDHASYVTFLPKSITTAIGMDVSAEHGGYVPITVAVPSCEWD